MSILMVVLYRTVREETREVILYSSLDFGNLGNYNTVRLLLWGFAFVLVSMLFFKDLFMFVLLRNYFIKVEFCCRWPRDWPVNIFQMIITRM